jgi:hypothetical protein
MRLFLIIAATTWACHHNGGGSETQDGGSVTEDGGSEHRDADAGNHDAGVGNQDAGSGNQGSGSGSGSGSDGSGSGSDGSGSDAASYSCDLTMTGTVTCTTYDYSGVTLTASEIMALEASCTDDGGTLADACTTVGAVGRCSYVESSGGMSVEERVWYYSGDVTTDGQACRDNGGTWTSGE